MPKILTPEERTEIRKLSKDGLVTAQLMARFGVSERTVQRVVKDAPSRAKGEVAAKKKKPTIQLPSERPIPECILHSAFIPYKRKENPEKLPNGQALVFNGLGALVRVEHCSMAGNQLIAWKVGTVEIAEIKDGVIRACVQKWCGETIEGTLVIDGDPVSGTVKNCVFYYDRLPKSVAKDGEKVRDALAAKIQELQACKAGMASRKGRSA